MAIQIAQRDTTDDLSASLPDWRPWATVAAALMVLYIPAFYDLVHGPWSTPDEGHGPVVLVIAAWLLWNRRTAILAAPAVDTPVRGWLCLLFGLSMFVLGRSQDLLTLEIGALPCIVLALLLLLHGPAAVRLAAFPLVFLLFMVPLPGVFVDTLTQPMARAVSHAAEQVLFWLGLPVARSGVVLQLGPYQLLVAEACAGLRSLFALEAMGLLYLNMRGHSSLTRILALAVLIVPIAVAANVIRVVSLALITYDLGDAAGQGFLHEFSGLVLYCAALLLIVGADSLAGLLSRMPRHEVGA
jgi:exosortase B